VFANHGRITMLGSARGSGVASPKIWGGAKFLGGKMFDFRRITLFSLAKPLSTHKMTIFSKKLGGHGPFRPPPWLLLGPRGKKQVCRLHVRNRSFRSKFTVLKKVPVTLLGLFGGARRHSTPHSDSAPGKLCPFCPPRYAPSANINLPISSGHLMP